MRSLYIAIIVFFCIMAPHTGHALEDGILAIVNSEVITIKDLRDYMKNVFAQLKIEGKSPGEINEIMTKYENKGIDQLVDDRLVLAAADQSGIIIKPAAIDEKLADIQKNYPSSQAFRDALVKEGMTVSDIRKKIESQFKGQIIIENEIRRKIAVNPQEVTEYFNAHVSEYEQHPRVYLNSIFVKTAFGSKDARNKIDQAMDEIKKGKDFKLVMAQYSELPPVGEIAMSDLRPELKDKVNGLAIGDVSDVVEMDNGYYIFKLEGRVAAVNASLTAEKDRIYQRLYEEKFRQRFKEWINGLRKKAYIEIKG